MSRAPPTRIREHVDQALAAIERSLGVSPDLTPETLGLLDAYVAGAKNSLDRVQDLVAAIAGCYFGEVVRRRFGGWWVLDGEAPAGWRVELESCYLVFFPVGMAAEILRRSEVAGYDGTFSTFAEDEPDLQAALTEVRVTEDEYYSFTGRIDTIERTVNWLVATRKKEGRMRVYTPGDYTA